MQLEPPSGGVEAELKLRFQPKHASAILASPAIRAHARSSPTTSRLNTLYFDSPDHALWKQGVALRVRRVRRRWVQSLKDEGREIAGLHTHREIEHELLAATPQPELLPKDVRELIMDDGASLEPVFATAVRRTSLSLSLGNGTEIELALDRGTIKTARGRERICEAELEVMHGAPGIAYALALELHRTVPFALEHRTKAERGFALLDGGPPAVYMARPLVLAADMPVNLALVAAAGEGLRQLGANEAVARLGEDIEGVHQMRVGLRRLKVALSLANKLKPVPEREALRHELDLIGDTLGRARDLDVFIAETLVPLGTRTRDDADLARLMRRAERARKSAYAELRVVLDSPRYTEALLRMGAWTSALHAPDTAYPPLAQFAGAILDKRFRRLRKFAKLHGWQAKSDLHALRLQAKKLRYSAAFFASLYPRKRTRAFLARIAALQDVLGLAHDGEVARGILVVLGTRPATDALPSAAWRRADSLIEGWHAGRGIEVAKHVEAAWTELKDAKPFW
jgi:inorganic triphosphatase YgiF